MPLIAPFIVALITTLVATPVVRRIARSRGYVAAPSASRWHRAPTALFGGIAIYLGAVAGSLIHFSVDRQTVAIGIAGTILFITGVVDDRYKLRPTSKLILQAVAAAVVIAANIILPITPWLPVNILITVFWLIGVTNALNLLDNMDGLATGVAAIAAAFLAIGFAMDGAWPLAAICIALFGATAGFLPYNFPPATIFMGDSGSLLIGGVLASLGAAYPSTAPGSVVSVLFVPALIVIIPLLDTSFVTLMRTLAGRPISEGGRDHTSHRLVAMGLSERQVALLLYAFAICGGVLALLMRSSFAGIGLFAGGVFLIVLLVSAAYLGRMHKYAPSEVIGNRKATVLVSNFLYKRNAFEVVFDMVLFSCAYAAAFYLRWDGHLNLTQADLMARSLAIVIACKSVSFGLFGVYRGVWAQLTISDVHRVVKATLLGSVLATAALAFVFRYNEFSRSVLIMDGVFTFVLAVGARASFRSLDRVREKLHVSGGTPAIIYGAGKAGELLVKELRSNRYFRMNPVSFVDDDPYKHGRLIAGLPVVADIARLASEIEARKARYVIISSRAIEEPNLQQIRDVCRAHDVELLELRIELRQALTERQYRPSVNA